MHSSLKNTKTNCINRGRQKPCFWQTVLLSPAKILWRFDVTAKRTNFCVLPTKTRALFLGHPKATKMAGVTQGKALLTKKAKALVSSSLN